jgi:uncharacterized protein (DUF697 family)
MKRVKQVMGVVAEVGAEVDAASARLLVVGVGAAAAQLRDELARDVGGREATDAGVDGAATDATSATVDAAGDIVEVLAPAAVSAVVAGRWAAVVILAQAETPADEAADLVRKLREGGVTLIAAVPATAVLVPNTAPSSGVIDSSAAPGATSWSRQAGFRGDEIVHGRPGGAGLAELVVRRLAARLGDKGLALAARVPLLRAAVVKRVIDTTARQNGVVGAAAFKRGADMPVMTINQIRMVLRIAAVYGEDLSTQRALEILSVVGAGLGFRALGRQARNMAPLAGWVIKGAFGYAATVSLGKAAVRYFDAGAPLAPEQARKISEKIDNFTQGPIGKRIISSG